MTKIKEEQIVENVRLTACVQIQNASLFHFQPSTGCFILVITNAKDLSTTVPFNAH